MLAEADRNWPKMAIGPVLTGLIMDEYCDLRGNRMGHVLLAAMC